MAFIRMGMAVMVAAMLWGGVAPQTGHAQDRRTSYLIRLLQTSSTFRVRAQAAISLGSLESHPRSVRALQRALNDDHPAVRSAAAASLGRLEATSALDALRAKRRDRDRRVRTAVSRAIRSLERVARSQPRTTPVPRTSSANARYYVGVGMPGSSERGVNRTTLNSARSFIRTRVSSMDGVVVAPESESQNQARRILRQRRLTGYYIDSSIVRIESRNGGIRAVVSVIVNTYPGRDMRAILQGAATVQGGGSGDAARRQAIEGALSGALRRLPQALQGADARGG